MTPNIDTTAKAQASTADINLDGNEKAFIINAYSKSIYIRELANMANKSASLKIRELAQKVYTDQQKLMEDLSLIAKGKGLLPESELSKVHQEKIEVIKKMPAGQFNEEFLNQLQVAQSELTQLYLTAAKLANQDLKNYARHATVIIHDEQTTTTKLIRLKGQNKSTTSSP